MAVWRVLVGVWTPRNWDLSLSALTPYTIPLTPLENPWIKKYRTPPTQSEVNSPVTSPTTPVASNDSRSDSATTVNNTSVPADCVTTNSSSTPRKKPPRTPSRRLIRHVLRARSKAAFELASFFTQLENASPSKKVYASPHLARRFGGGLNDTSSDRKDFTFLPNSSSASLSEEHANIGSGTAHAVGLGLDMRISSESTIIDPESNMSSHGWRYAREVVTYLRENGAKIPTIKEDVDGEWAALSSDGAGDMSGI